MSKRGDDVGEGGRMEEGGRGVMLLLVAFFLFVCFLKKKCEL